MVTPSNSLSIRGGSSASVIITIRYFQSKITLENFIYLKTEGVFRFCPISRWMDTPSIMAHNDEAEEKTKDDCADDKEVACRCLADC